MEFKLVDGYNNKVGTVIIDEDHMVNKIKCSFNGYIINELQNFRLLIPNKEHGDKFNPKIIPNGTMARTESYRDGSFKHILNTFDDVLDKIGYIKDKIKYLSKSK